LEQNNKAAQEQASYTSEIHKALQAKGKDKRLGNEKM
jgi:hypothetical protein